jgi:hypothetical protein
VALKSNTAAKKSKDQLSRNFSGRSIFDFCNNICQQRRSRQGSLDHLATIPKDGPVTRSRHPQARNDLRPVATGSIIALGKVASRAVAIRMQIEDSRHNTKMFRRPKPGTAGSL